REEIVETGRTIHADATEINQVVTNLCTNAAQAIGERPGTIGIGVRPSSRGPGDGAWVELSVVDDGSGMDEKVIARMFEPFFTTKKTGQGTGLGLAVVHGIVTHMGGEISVESEPGRGTTFRVLLPQHDGSPAPDETAVGSAPRGHGEKVLLVDDEESICAAGGRIVKNLGYVVTTMIRPFDVLEAVRRDPDAWNVVLTDYTMPGVNGIELARALSGIAPKLPVVMMTGTRAAELETRAREAGVCRLLLKPFRPIEVAEALRDALETAPPQGARAPADG
ncbi:MAG TPA: ATP-binding protein, partial [Spirochaetia bacterium]